MVQNLTQTKFSPEEITGQLEQEVRSLWRMMPRGILRGAELLVSAIPVLCIIATVIAQVLYTGYNPWQDAISSLVWSPHGAIQTAVFYLLGFSVLILAVKLFFKAKQTVLKTGIIALALTGVGMVMVGIFPAARNGFPQTVISDIHLNTSSALIFLFPIACFIMAPKLKECFSRRWLSTYTLISGILGIVFIGVEAWLHFAGRGWMGTLERLEILNGIAWVQTVTILTLNNSSQKRPETAGELKNAAKSEAKPRRTSRIIRAAALTALCALILVPAIQFAGRSRKKQVKGGC